LAKHFFNSNLGKTFAKPKFWVNVDKPHIWQNSKFDQNHIWQNIGKTLVK
jgi:hypothetical protein